jgi:hypothetical protein
MQTYEGKEYPTQALIENCMVCRSQRTGLGFWPAVADGPEVLVVDPAGEIVWYNYNHMEEAKWQNNNKKLNSTFITYADNGIHVTIF